jgi:hypothetical protein
VEVSAIASVGVMSRYGDLHLKCFGIAGRLARKDWQFLFGRGGM